MKNLLMKFVNLIADTTDGLTNKEGDGWLDNIIGPVQDVVNAIIVPVLILIATVGVVYAIVLGVNYAKAETSDQKEEAKKRIINVVVGALLMIVLMLLLYLFIDNADNIKTWLDGFRKNADKPSTETTARVFLSLFR